MSDPFLALDHFTIKDHGDGREKAVWSVVSNELGGYEAFWQALIVLLTNRVDPKIIGSGWIRLRSGIPREYEKLAMHNYSVLYYAGSARAQMEDDRLRLKMSQHPCPERVFFSFRACTENASALRAEAVRILGAIKIGLAPEPPGPNKTIRTYRNALTHNPVLGRAVSHGRELLPPEAKLPTRTRPLLWRDIEKIPASQMNDCLDLETRVWHDLAGYLQDLWKSLVTAFVAARQHPKFLADLGLGQFLPIREPVAASVVGPPAASGTNVVARSDAV